MSNEDSHPLVRTWSLPEGLPRTVARLDSLGGFSLDPGGRWLAYGRGRKLLLRSVDGSGPSPERIVGQLGDDLVGAEFLDRGDHLASLDKSGEIRLWSPARGGSSRVLEPANGTLGDVQAGAAEPEGQRLAVGDESLSVHTWDLRDPPDAEPVVVKRPDTNVGMWLAFDPSGPWLATNNGYSVAFWPLSSPSSRPLRGQKTMSHRLSFSPDSRWLASCVGETRLFPLNPADGGMRTLAPGMACWGLAIHPAGTHVLVGASGAVPLLCPIAGGPPRALATGWEGAVVAAGVTIDASGRSGGRRSIRRRGSPAPRAPRPARLGPADRRGAHLLSRPSHRGLLGGFWSLRYAPDGSLFAAGQGIVRHLVLPADGGGTVSSETIYPTEGAPGGAEIDLSRDGRTLLVMGTRNPFPQVNEDLVVFDLAAHTSRRITTHGRRLPHVALDPSGRIVVTGDVDGVVRVGPVTGEEPHLLLGHGGPSYRRRRLPRRPLGRVGERPRPPLADARRDEAAAPHAARTRS